MLWELSAPKGYVIGLHGAWGSGKTTALNFIAHFLKAKNRAQPARAVEMVRFSPWMFSGHQDLISAYFRVLAEALQGGNRPPSRGLQRRGRHEPRGLPRRPRTLA